MADLKHNLQQNYEEVKKYITEVEVAIDNLKYIKRRVIATFRKKELFEEIKKIIEKKDFSLNSGEDIDKDKDYLQIYKDNKDIHLEWLLDNLSEPGFICNKNKELPLHFHLEGSYNKDEYYEKTFDYLKQKKNDYKLKYKEKEEALEWENEEWEISISKRITTKENKIKLSIKPLKQEISAQELSWLNSLLECEPIKLLLNCLKDSEFYTALQNK